MKVKKLLNKHILAFVLSVVVGFAGLILAAFLPQGRIMDNLWDSIDYLHQEGNYPRMSDYSDASQLDNFTDILMLLETVTTHDGYLGSVLTNPVYVYDNAGSDLAALLECYLNQMPHDSVGYYVRYWMGFRVILRALLVFLDYFQIRRYLAVLFFGLFAAVMCSMAKRLDSRLAFVFAVSVILIRPYIIANSLQCSCCFLIMFLAMLLIPKLYNRPKWETLFFMEIGVITMYFDFYTVPLITFGFPLVYLYALHAQDGKTYPVKRIFKNIAFWFVGYVLMWLAKLTLTTVFTDINALGNGLSALLGRIGVKKDPELEQFYSLSLAAEELKEAIFCDGEGKVIFLLAVLAVAVGALVLGMRRKVTLKTVKAYGALPMMAILPFVWFLATAQPIAMHAFFQYRSIALTYWAIGVYLCFLFRNEKTIK